MELCSTGQTRDRNGARVSKHELPDISGYGYADLAYLQRKLSAAGEMKTAIKRTLDEIEFPDLYPRRALVPKRRLKELRQAMEDFLNT